MVFFAKVAQDIISMLMNITNNTMHLKYKKSLKHNGPFAFGNSPLHRFVSFCSSWMEFHDYEFKTYIKSQTQWSRVPFHTTHRTALLYEKYDYSEWAPLLTHKRKVASLFLNVSVKIWHSTSESRQDFDRSWTAVSSAFFEWSSDAYFSFSAVTTTNS